MAGKIPEQAELEMLQQFIGIFLGDSYAHLLNANVAMNTATLLSDCQTNEANFAGYAPAHLTSWTVPVIDGTTAAISTTTLAQFTPTGVGGSGNLYGYWLQNSAGTSWYGGEIFATVPVTVNQGITLEIDITYSFISRF